MVDVTYCPKAQKRIWEKREGKERGEGGEGGGHDGGWDLVKSHWAHLEVMKREDRRVDRAVEEQRWLGSHSVLCKVLLA